MLTIENLEKRFTSHILDRKQITGFERISFIVPKGTATGLCGPSGYGKSSVLKCIYRTYLPTAGTITFDSVTFGRVDLATLAENQILTLRRTEIGYVTQFLSVLPRVAARDVVAEPLVNAGLSLDEARLKAGDLLERLRISSRLHDAFPATFSGGEKQRVNLARAVIRPPRMLLLDEPTASLDAETTQVVLELLIDLKSQGTTIIAIFHDSTILDQLVDAVYLMPERETHS